jgi:hypothetical protein
LANRGITAPPSSDISIWRHLNRAGFKRLDVGANSTEYSESDNYLEKHYAIPAKITAVTIEDPVPLQTRYPQVRIVQGDGRKLPFADNEFDIFYSNAVIEHVGSAEDQKAFLKEAVRVAKMGFLTTPNKHFPIETHTRVPLLHMLPKRFFDRFLTWIGKSWATGNYMNLLSKGQIAKLAIKAGLDNFEVYSSNVLGIPMTYILIWKKEASDLTGGSRR